jgi:dTDP-4-amino-4,6-dideoxygalactose transaminase
VRRLEEAAVPPSAARSLLLRGLVLGAERAGDGRLFRAGRAAYRGLSRLGLVPASSDRAELSGIHQPAGFLAKLAPWQARRGLERLDALEAQVTARRSIAARYTAWLAERGLEHPIEPPGLEHAYLRFPLQVHDRERFRVAAGRAGIDLGDWFVSPLHPITTGLEGWAYRPGSAPIAEGICARIVNLPTDPRMSDAAVDRVLALLERTADLLR